MTSRPDVNWQRSLFGAEAPAFDRSFARVARIHFAPDAWLDHGVAWVSGADTLFREVIQARDWLQRARPMHGRQVIEPRLTSPWNLESGEPLAPHLVEELRLALSERYGVVFDSVGFNLYRDGRDSVAWHSDHIRKEIEDPIIALVSLGEPRRFLLRPKGGGRSIPFMLGRGDLLVTGGKAQRTWEHSVPKVAKAGPRISLAFRHGLHPDAYARKTIVDRPPR